MVAVICTLIICVAAVVMYGMFLTFKRAEPKVKVEPEEDPYEVSEPQTYSYRKAAPKPPEGVIIPSAPVKERVIPAAAQEYLDAADRLMAKGHAHDLKGMSMIGDHDREEAAKCRAKAERLIERANNV